MASAKTEETDEHVSVTAISVAANHDPAIAFAARMLSSYLFTLFGVRATVRRNAAPSGDLTFRLSCDKTLFQSNLAEQCYLIRRAEDQSVQAYELIGGSPPALIWAVSELAEFWGVRFLSYRDVFPENAGSFRMPNATIVRQPLFGTRGIRIYNDWPNDPCRWSASEIDVLIDQLSKMRINTAGMFVRPYDPFYRFEWRGACKNLALTNYGLELPISDKSIGYELFQASGDATRGSFSNPDLDHKRSFEQSVFAAQRFLAQIRQATRDRGIRLSAIVVFSDFPEPVKRRLVEVSKDAELPAVDQSGPLTRFRIGQWTEGCTRDMARAMSIRNPHYLDLLQANLRAHLEALRDFDELYLWPSEFRGSAADAEYAWQDLDRRYHLSEVMSLDAIVREARDRAECGADRAEHELRADVVILWIFDYLLNDAFKDKQQDGPKLCPAGLNPSLQRVMPRIFGSDVRYLAAIGYMPTTIARHIDSFSEFRSDSAKTIIFTTLEDDNIGPVPQESTPSIATLTGVLRQNRLDGFLTRQWNYSKVILSLHYLTHAAWDPDLTGSGSIEHLFLPLCGESTMPALRAAVELLQKSTYELQAQHICPAFLSPHLIAGRWALDSADFGGAATQERDSRILKQYEQAAEQFERAVARALPAGKSILEKLQKQAEFACAWLKGLRELAIAVELKRQSRQADAEHDIDAFDRFQLMSVQHLDSAAKLVREATECWAQAVADRADLGTLAALNEYGVKAIESIRHLAQLDATHWSRKLVTSCEDGAC